MKVGITCYPTYGGSGIVATELGLELANRGHEVHFISYANPIRLDAGTPRVYYHEVEVSTYPLFQYPPYCLALASRMAEVAERQNLDLLHVHYAIPHSIAAMLAQQMLASQRRLPFVTTLHGTDITLVGADRSYFPITKFSIEQSDDVTSVSDYLKRRTVEVFGVEKEIRTITNFVNCDIYRPDRDRYPAIPGVPDGSKVLIHLSNFRPVKRVTDCVRILERVRREADAHLVLVGDGPECGPVERLVQELGLVPHVTFLGKQNHVERIIPRADVLLLPSELESFGLAALEAMACGVPPVATDVGGVSELITHGEDGYLEAVGDVEAQAARVSELLSSTPLHDRMRDSARLTALTRFCSSLVIPRYVGCYEEVCAR